MWLQIKGSYKHLLIRYFSVKIVEDHVIFPFYFAILQNKPITLS